MEGSILSAGSTIQWLRDGLKIIRDGAHAGELAASVEDTAGVYMVPAFTGLGAPHWDPDARGGLLGLTRGTEIAHIARAALEAAAYQSAEVLGAMSGGQLKLESLRVDGGMARNDWFLQFLSDVLDVEVVRPANTETTALGAAILAAVGAGLFGSLEEAAGLWKLDRRFEPRISPAQRASGFDAWMQAVGRVKTR
jgi:glycerol kinase